MLRKLSFVYCIIIAVCCLFSSSCIEPCSKKILCPGFGDTVLPKWFPYSKGMKISFATNSNRVQNCTFDTIPSTTPYEIDSRFGCQAEKGFVSRETDSSGWQFMKLNMKIMQNEAGKVAYRLIEFRMFNMFMQCEDLTDNGFIRFIPQSGLQADTPRIVQFHNTIQLNGKLFSNVQSVLLDTVRPKKPFVYKFYIGRNQGIVAYETSDSALLWVKQ